jgi:hypothetical protein
MENGVGQLEEEKGRVERRIEVEKVVEVEERMELKGMKIEGDEGKEWTGTLLLREKESQMKKRNVLTDALIVNTDSLTVSNLLLSLSFSPSSTFSGVVLLSSPPSLSSGTLLLSQCKWENANNNPLHLTLVSGVEGVIEIEHTSFLLNIPSSFTLSFSPLSLRIDKTTLSLWNCSFKDMNLVDGQLVSILAPPPLLLNKYSHSQKNVIQNV